MERKELTDNELRDLGLEIIRLLTKRCATGDTTFNPRPVLQVLEQVIGSFIAGSANDQFPRMMLYHQFCGALKRGLEEMPDLSKAN